jgi:hypothetical protein
MILKMYLYKEYIELNGQTIKFSISFNREHTNWATSQAKKIGYQVTVLPVKISKLEGGFTLEESSCFTGFNDNLLEVERQSAKRLETAKAILTERKEKYLNHFRNQTV